MDFLFDLSSLLISKQFLHLILLLSLVTMPNSALEDVRFGKRTGVLKEHCKSKNSTQIQVTISNP